MHDPFIVQKTGKQEFVDWIENDNYEMIQESKLW